MDLFDAAYIFCESNALLTQFTPHLKSAATTVYHLLSAVAAGLQEHCLKEPFSLKKTLLIK